MHARSDDREAALTAADQWTIDHLVVVAGPTTSGKSHFIRMLRGNDRLRERLGVAENAPALTAGKFVNLPVVGTIDQLVLHYDILRPLRRGFPSYELDPGAAIFGQSGAITFCTLRVTPERLSAQLEQRIARRKNPPKGLSKLRPIYADATQVADWYARWDRFVRQFSDVTAAAYLVDVSEAESLDDDAVVVLERV